jgi:hypothetical protein
MVIALPNGRVNRIPQNIAIASKHALLQFRGLQCANPFRFDSSRTLNCSSNLIGHDHPHKPVNGGGNNRTFQRSDGSRARKQGGKNKKAKN